MIKRTNKYNAVKAEMDGIKFDSTLERNCYRVIKEHGLLNDTVLQQEYILQPKFRADSGKVIQPIKYVCDFVVFDRYVLDAKGLLLSEFKMKRKMLLFQKKLEIICVGSIIDMNSTCVMMKNNMMPSIIIEELKQHKKNRKRKK